MHGTPARRGSGAAKRLATLVKYDDFGEFENRETPSFWMTAT